MHRDQGARRLRLSPMVSTCLPIRLRSRRGRWRQMSLRAEELPVLARHALEHGFEGPALAQLAGQDPADVRDSRDLFAVALAELGIPVPARDAAGQRRRASSPASFLRSSQHGRSSDGRAPSRTAATCESSSDSHQNLRITSKTAPAWRAASSTRPGRSFNGPSRAYGSSSWPVSTAHRCREASVQVP
jgi:hypothetical protein